MSQTYLAIQTLGFATGAVLFLLLFALSHKAVRLIGDGRGTRLAAAMGLLWNLGSLAAYILRLYGSEELSQPILIARAFAYTGTAFLSTGLFLVQFDRQEQERQVHQWRWLISASYTIGGGLTLGFFITATVPEYHHGFGAVMKISAYNLALHLATGVIFFRRDRERSGYTGAFLSMVSALVALLFLLIHFALNKSWEQALSVLAQQSSIPMAMVALTRLGQFRFADVFVRQSFLVLAAVTLAASYQWLVVGPLMRGAVSVAAHPEAAAWITVTILWIVLLLLFPLIKQNLIYAANRWLFRHPDYSRLTLEFQQSIERMPGEKELFTLAENRIRDVLRVADARVIERDDAALDDRETEQEIIYLRPDHPAHKLIGELKVDALLPIREQAEVRYLLSVSPGKGNRKLLSDEIAWLAAIAERLGRRLESMRFERERQERDLHEARLRHSLTEAELKALQAQINPHFLFNTLNTIADLIGSEPQKAEAMTERLAEVFRYVLQQTQNNSIPVSEEFDFLRTYLEIEQTRYGLRLRVEMKMDPSVADAQIPPLILQPLIENAIKHGIAPKRAGGTLTICATDEIENLRLTVADDGAGWREIRAGNGIGLRNVRERLQTLYQSCAKMEINSAPETGTRISITIPKDETPNPDRRRRGIGEIAPEEAPRCAP